MNRWFRYLLLTLVLVGIVTSITYLENLKPNAAPATATTKDFVNPSAFINSTPFTLAEEVGKKVVLVDFWTYSCINCQRTQPYLNEWWKKYKDKGLLIVGVHSPEFEFEKEQSNVEAAIKELDITYPVVMDNDHGTWNAFENRYWPRKYLIDLSGNIVYDHIGEGNYEETEAEIQKVLGLSNMGTATPQEAVEIDYNKVGSPETYLGTERTSNLSLVSTAPSSLEPNQAYLVGDWQQEEEYAENQSPTASVLFDYNAKNVYMVASATAPTEVEVWLDGKLLKTITVEANLLYPLVEGDNYAPHTLKIIPKAPGLKLFTLTFG